MTVPRNNSGIVHGNVRQDEGGTDPWLVAEQGLSLRFDSSASPLLYLGLAQPGTSTSDASWQIQRIDTTTGVAILWADGNNLFDNVWDDRASLSYS